MQVFLVTWVYRSHYYSDYCKAYNAIQAMATIARMLKPECKMIDATPIVWSGEYYGIVA